MLNFSLRGILIRTQHDSTSKAKENYHNFCKKKSYNEWKFKRVFLKSTQYDAFTGARFYICFSWKNNSNFIMYRYTSLHERIPIKYGVYV
jgi:hypothetical protein